LEVAPTGELAFKERMIARYSTVLSFFLLAVMCQSAKLSAAERPDPALADFFEADIRPLLVERCFKCHGDLKKPKAGLRLTSRASVLKGGETGPAAVPGKPEESLLIHAVRHENGLEMPPDEKLNEAQIGKLARWIKMGLPWPEAKAQAATSDKGQEYRITEEQRRFWSFQPLKATSLPTVKEASWPRSDIDRFILTGLEAKGLRPARPADKRTLLRRATFDLTGLPPTPRELDSFLADESPNAFAKVVDRLLASPHYGERWGRHWLDVVRYTDSFDARILTGDGRIMDITEAYRYRDWVVDALNHDMPYDEFIIHQIAGDLLPPKEPGGVYIPGIVATGMLAIGNWGGGDADKEKLLTDIVDDQIDVVSRAFLGLTVACARCHDHKFDPISTEDYYSLAGIFFSCHILQDPGPKTNGPPMLRIPLIPAAEVERRRQTENRIAELEKQLKLVGKDLRTLLGASPLSPGGPYLLAAWAQQHPVERIKKELQTLKKNLPPISYANGAQEGGCPLSPQVGVHDVRVHIRGRYDRLGKPVPRRFPRIIAGENQQPITQGSGRMQLAKWIASSANPLTARVMVNRIWQHHFGEGLVRTPGNFGKLGEPPTHPELLDYLARQFIQSGWSMKAMHRAIMLSATYQQASIPDRANLQSDPDNRLFGRMNRRRLEAEELRDCLLAVTGRLDPTLGGRASLDFNLPRRTLYLMTVRSDRSSFRELFDAADPTAITDKRVVSTVAPQALFLLNHPFALEQTKQLIKRVVQEAPADDSGKIERLYSLLYGRPPSTEEANIGFSFLAQARSAPNVPGNGTKTNIAWEEYCQVLLCANEFIYVD
jgi:hypothetical protein